MKILPPLTLCRWSVVFEAALNRFGVVALRIFKMTEENFRICMYVPTTYVRIYVCTYVRMYMCTNMSVRRKRARTRGRKRILDISGRDPNLSKGACCAGEY